MGGISSCKCACKVLKQMFLAAQIYKEAPRYSHKHGDASVGHGIGKSQDSTSHDGIAQVKHRHTKRRRTRALKNRNSEIYMCKTALSDETSQTRSTTYIFSFIFLLAQLMISEEVLAFRVHVGILHSVTTSSVH